MSNISRSAGRSATAAAAYRSAERIEDQRTGEVHDYERRSGVERTELFGWQGSRAELWNAAEASERRRNSQVAREMQVALPRELNEAQRWALTEHMARHLASTYGVAVDAAMHCPYARDGEQQPHAHIMFTTRRVEGGTFGAKTRELDDRRTGPAHVEGMRAEWARVMNEALAAAGEAARVEHRSYRRQGIHREREHIGRAALALEAKGEPTERAREVAGAISRNDRRAMLRSVTASPRPRQVTSPDPAELGLAVEADREAAHEQHATRQQAKAAGRVARWREQQAQHEQPERAPEPLPLELPPHSPPATDHHEQAHEQPARGRRR